MHQITDTKGRDWNLNVNVGSIRRVKARTGVDLLMFMEPKENEKGEKEEEAVLLKLFEDPFLLTGVLAALCEPQMEERKVGQSDFEESFTLDTLMTALNVLSDEVFDFFPKPRREVYRAQKAAIDKASEAVYSEMQRLVESGQLEKLQEEARGKPSTDSPES